MLTTLCYIDQNDAYLMLHRNKKENDINKNKWIGIGGKFETDESPDEAMIREVYEETGLTILEYQFRGIVTFSYNGKTEYMHVFTSNHIGGELKECNEGTLAWVKKKDVFDLNLWQGDRIFLKLLLETKEFFSLKLIYQGDYLKQAILNNKEILHEK
ncbi:MAG: 8-oxo-dGTP diphosphatase [Erysipelotrichaceae bacterium]|nr:8-oxo-dGTP diphosphatase [Erysipelotrichaceae bacterium]